MSTGRQRQQRNETELRSQALRKQLDVAMGADTLALRSEQGGFGENVGMGAGTLALAGVQEGSHTSRTDVAVTDTHAHVDMSTFTLPERRSSQPEILVTVVKLSDKPMDHGVVTRMVITQV
jgi:hypothetical protein